MWGGWGGDRRPGAGEGQGERCGVGGWRPTTTAHYIWRKPKTAKTNEKQTKPRKHKEKL